MTEANGIEDRAAFHLLGHPLPALIDLASTSGTTVDLFTLSLRHPIMLFVYPSTASPLRSTPSGWSDIPGASGCTPHLISVATHLPHLLAKEPQLKVFGEELSEKDDAATERRSDYEIGLSDKKPRRGAETGSRLTED
uniref:Redoxin domain-containing protein n=1 Tax=Melanopsichium pennsylvanicum 4 TaxID=1398559 RepID=A0A077R9Z4_9BASI|nr:redoxin domain-containing protein [Melanopsichium pennsylvanicum 4]